VTCAAFLFRALTAIINEVRVPAVTFALVCWLAAPSAWAQESTIREVTPEQAANPTTTAPSNPSTTTPSTSTPSTTTSATSAQASTTSSISTVGAPSTSPTAAGTVQVSARAPLPPDWNDRWHRSRVLYGVGGVTGLLGTTLSLASVAAVVITGYPCSPLDTDPMSKCKNAIDHPSSPTDAAPMLAFLGSSVSALGFVLSAAGLGYQHSLLTEVNADPGRGVFIGGTVIGVLGFASVGTSYFFGLTNYLNPHDQGVAILASTLTGAGLCALGGLLYLIDSARMKKAWERVTTF
jgi:hypothetical protein